MPLRCTPVRDRVLAAQERRPARRADRALAVGPVERRPLRRQPVDVRRPGARMAEEGQGVPALLVGADPEDVRLRHASRQGRGARASPTRPRKANGNHVCAGPACLRAGRAACCGAERRRARMNRQIRQADEGHASDPRRRLPDGLRPALSRGGAGAPRPGRGLRDGRDHGHQPPVRRLRRRDRLRHRRRAAARPGGYPGRRAARAPARQRGLPHDRRARSTPATSATGGAGRRAPAGAIPRGRAARSRAARTIRWSMSPSRTPRPTPPGPARRCRPRPSGSSPRAAGSRAREFAWGDELAPRGRHVANTWQGAFPWQNFAEDGHPGTCPVRSFPPNGYGLYEVCGNVWEWTTDWFAPRHAAASPGEAPCCAPTTLADRRWRGATTPRSREPRSRARW